jgi:Carboxypeptidase regulatory-like domain
MYRFWITLFPLLLAPAILAAQDLILQGRVVDPSGNALQGAAIQLIEGERVVAKTQSASDGHFSFPVHSPGGFTIKANSPGFQPITQTLTVRPRANADITIRMTQLAPKIDSITVTADVTDGDVLSPDPAMKVFAAEDLLDANPGRPGAPVSIPGYPIETASGGIKAPQYFAPGVAGDHGEPIAQYIQVGSYLVPNNLSANAHGNGYSDPNIYIADVIESVQIDGGAFNVREGNHALNLAAIYGLRSYLNPFLTLTADYRDATLTAGMSPSPDSWLAMEGSFGNGFLDRLEHRKQFKLNGGRVFHAGDHTLTLFGIAYLGYGYVAGLRPIFGFNSVDTAAGWLEFPDTIDPRQKDQTHTALLALNDVWKLTPSQQLQLSGFFRTYNLSLFSDFGLGLIRQSEFRTVAGANVTYLNEFTKSFTLLAGIDYNREAPRRDNLDHYNFYNPAEPDDYGPFIKIDSNNVTISPVTPFVAGQGDLGSHFRYYLGLRRDEIHIDNQDLLTPANSSNQWVGLTSPKATFTLLPGSWNAPLVSLSFGKSFFTEDPRLGTDLNNPIHPQPVETARSYQLVASKTFHSTDLKLTLGHETQTAEYGKIDPDQGLQFDLGPGRIRYLAFTLRQKIRNGSLQATFEQADARLVNTSFSVIPEAPRLIGDLVATYQKLPFRLQTKGEFEYVGQKVVGNGCNERDYLSGDPNALNYYCLGVPDKEFRLAITRPFLEGRLNVGINTMIATGWTGQTTENFAVAGVYGPGKVGLGPNGLVPANPVSEVVGVRIPSYASINITYRFARNPAHY